MKIIYRDSFLTTLIKREKKKLCKGLGFQRFRNLQEQIYFPSLQSFITVALISLLFFILSHCERFNIFSKTLNFDFSNHYQNLIAIHAGIGAIIFALVIFIAESLRDDKATDKARVLLRESFLFPLVVGEILVFFNFIWGDINFWGIFPVILVGIFTLISLSRLILVLLDKFRFFSKRLQLLKDRLKRSINLAIDERLGNNILLKQLGEGKIELDYYPLAKKMSNIEFHCFSTPKRGVVSDINLDRLNEFAKIIEEEANKNNYSFYKNKAKTKRRLVPEIDSINLISGAETEKYIENKKHYLLKKYRDPINEENKVLLCVNKQAVKSTKVIKRLDKLTSQIFTIKKGDNFSEQIRQDLFGIKDQFINAILNKKLGEINDFIKIYINLAEAFLESLKSCGGGFTFEQAQKERGTILGGWSEIGWILEDIREVFSKAIESHDKDIIANVGYLPIAIASRAVESLDHYLFQEFIRFAEYLYASSQREPEPSLRSFMIDRSWRNLKGVADYHIAPKLKENDVKREELLRLKDFAIYFFIIFQNLLKSASEKRDLDSFKQFKKVLNDLFKHFNPSSDHPNAEHLKWLLEKSRLPEDQRKEIERRLNRQQLLEKMEKEIKFRKNQMIFGLTSWLLEQYKNDLTNNTLNFYLEMQSSLPNDLRELTRVFLSVHKFEVEDFWGWGWWEMEKLPEEEVHHIDVFSKLERLYCIKSLQILEKKPIEEIEKIELPHDRNLAFLAEESSSLMKLLDAIKNTPQNWRFILSQDAINKIPQLKELLKKAAQKQEEKEANYLRNVELSNKKIKEFLFIFRKEFYGNATLRTLVTRAGILRDFSSGKELKPEIKLWGFNQIDDKAAFIEDWHVHYPNWGEQYGRGLAESENERVFEEIADNLKEIKIPNKKDIVAAIEKLLSRESIENPIVIGSFDYDLEYKGLRESDKFIDRWRNKCPELGFNDIDSYLGCIKLKNIHIPIFRIFLRKPDLKKTVCILSLKKIGEWKQYPPIEKIEDKQHQKDIFMIRIRDLNKDEKFRADLISKNPEWLQRYKDKNGYLRQKVVINIFEKFEFKILDKTAGYKLIIQ